MSRKNRMIFIFAFIIFLCSGTLVLYAFNQADLQKLNSTNKCPKCDLSNANLSKIDMYGADLLGANLAGANLSESAFEDADLRGANLTGANIKGTSFSGAKLSDTIWADGRKCTSGSIGKCK